MHIFACMALITLFVFGAYYLIPVNLLSFVTLSFTLCEVSCLCNYGSESDISCACILLGLGLVSQAEFPEIELLAQKHSL